MIVQTVSGSLLGRIIKIILKYDCLAMIFIFVIIIDTGQMH